MPYQPKTEKEVKKVKPEEVKDTREVLGLTQREFAEKIGTNPETVSRWENGVNPVSKCFIKLIEQL